MTGSDLEVANGATPWASRGVILDCCALLNLYASRRIDEILSAMPRPCAIADYVRDREALWVGSHKGGASADQERVDVAPLITTGLIEVVTLEGDEEMAHFLTLVSSSRIDDGEAMCGALAHARGLIVATDDKAALKVFGRHSPSIPTCSTASLVKHWADRATVDAASLRRVLINIRERACFEPGPRDPLQAWWLAALDNA